MKEIEAYLNGMMNVISSISKNIGPSYILVECYKKNDFKEEFQKRYSINNFKINEEGNIKEYLKNWFSCEEKIIDSVIYWTTRKVGKINRFYTLDDNLLYSKMEKRSLFSFIEDIIILETNEYMILYIMGNNE